MTQSSIIPTNPSIINTFNFGDQPVRVVIRDGEPWFVAADVADALAYRDASNLTRSLDDDEVRTHNLSTNRGPRDFTIISESGLYTAILKSRRPEAKQFKRWVTSEVLPSIRKTGSYTLPTRYGRFRKGEEKKFLPPQVKRNLTEAIAQIAHDIPHGGLTPSMEWHIQERIRRVAKVMSINYLEVRDLPLVMHELKRILALVDRFQGLQYRASAMLIKRCLQNNEAENRVITDLREMYYEIGRKSERALLDMLPDLTEQRVLGELEESVQEVIDKEEGRPPRFIPGKSIPPKYAWKGQIVLWLDKASTKELIEKQGGVTTIDIMTQALHFTKPDRWVQTCVGVIMKELGWGKRQKRFGNSRAYVYERG